VGRKILPSYEQVLLELIAEKKLIRRSDPMYRVACFKRLPGTDNAVDFCADRMYDSSSGPDTFRVAINPSKQPAFVLEEMLAKSDPIFERLDGQDTISWFAGTRNSGFRTAS
jgi:hypothetical protein